MGRLMNHNDKTTGNRIGQTVDKVSGDDMNHFPIKRARARGSWVLLSVYIRALAGYGWAVQKHAHQRIPLIPSGSCWVPSTFASNKRLMLCWWTSSREAPACRNITRCALSAVAVAVTQPFVDVMEEDS